MVLAVSCPACGCAFHASVGSDDVQCPHCASKGRIDLRGMVSFNPDVRATGTVRGPDGSVLYG